MTIYLKSWFDEDYYMEAKLAQLQEINEKDISGNAYTRSSLEKAIVDAGMTPIEHYFRYGRSEGINPNAWFDESYYMNIKLTQLHEINEKDIFGNPYTLSSLKKAIADAGMTPIEHYLQYGQNEGLNPNSWFNANYYINAKLEQLHTINEKDSFGNSYTYFSLKKAIADAGMSPVEHYLKYGKAEGLQPSANFIQNLEVKVSGSSYSYWGDRDGFSAFRFFLENIPEQSSLPDKNYLTLKNNGKEIPVESISFDENALVIKIPQGSYSSGSFLITYSKNSEDVQDQIGKALEIFTKYIYERDYVDHNDTIQTATQLTMTKDIIYGLAIDDADDIDFYTFKLDRPQTINDSLNIFFDHASGDLNIILFDENENPIRYAMSKTDNEQISLRDLDAGIYYLKIFGNDGDTNQYSLEYTFNSGEKYKSLSEGLDFDPVPTICHIPNAISVSKIALKNASVGLDYIHIPNITIRDLPNDILTVTLEGDCCKFNFNTTFHNNITLSNHGKTAILSGTTELINEILETMTLEPTATAISRINADINTVANINIFVTDGNSQTHKTFKIYSDNYDASSFYIGDREYVYVNGISDAEKYHFNKWSTITNKIIFDAEKQDHADRGDSFLCWAATASNMLAWTQWGQRGLKISSNTPDPEDIIFKYFIDHFTNKPGHAYYGIEWFFDGEYFKIKDHSTAQPNFGSGNLLGISAKDYLTYFLFDNQAQDTMALLASALHSGEAVGLGICGPSSHAITCWGYSYREDLKENNPAYYTGLLISDSDNSRKLTPSPDEMVHVPLSWSEAESRYYLGGDYRGQYYLVDATTLARQFSNGDPLAQYGWLSGNPTELPLIGSIADSGESSSWIEA